MQAVTNRAGCCCCDTSGCHGYLESECQSESVSGGTPVASHLKLHHTDGGGGESEAALPHKPAGECVHAGNTTATQQLTKGFAVHGVSAATGSERVSPLLRWTGMLSDLSRR